MTCCLEEALLAALRDLEGTPIPSGNHFHLTRKCKDCVPYLVLKTVDTPGLKTSSGLQVISAVELNAYFSADREDQANSYKTLLQEWMSSSPCIELGECGCFCLRSLSSSRVVTAVGGLIRVGVNFNGTYQATVSSASESV